MQKLCVNVISTPWRSMHCSGVCLSCVRFPQAQGVKDIQVPTIGKIPNVTNNYTDHQALSQHCIHVTSSSTCVWKPGVDCLTLVTSLKQWRWQICWGMLYTSSNGLVCRRKPCEFLLPLALGLHCPSPTDHPRRTTRQTHDLTSDIPSHQTEDFLS